MCARRAATGAGTLRRVNSESDWIQISPRPLDTELAITHVSATTAGGVAVFLGTTRDETNASGQQLAALDYEAYEQMALGQLHQLADQARQRWPIVKLAILHRTGRVAPAE